MTLMRRSWMIAALAAIVVACAHARAGIADTAFTYQGELQDGGALANGMYDMEFSMWEALSGGGQLGTSVVINDVPVNDGRFTVELDFGAEDLNNEARWLEIVVDGAMLSPRQAITRAPYAIQTRGIFVDDDHNVGIGTTPDHPFHLLGDMRVEGRLAMGNDAYYGLGSGPYPEFDRLYDFSQVITDFSSSDAWSPILSVFTLDPTIDLTLTQVYGSSFEAHTAAASTENMAFVNGLTGGAVHRGSGTLTNLFGGFMFSGQREGAGDITNNFGLFAGGSVGFDSAGSIENNIGITISTGHQGTGGSVQNNTGLRVQTPIAAQPIDTNYGIYLQDQDVAQTTNYAIYSEGGDVFFDGDLEVTGTLSKGAGAFKIDHPLDPENKYLSHSFVESPDMMNVYSGNVALDDSGRAVVNLPDWFEALNCDFRYQLTCIGGYAPVYIAEKIKGNTFIIAGGSAGLEVSWQVTATRNDPYAMANRIQVESDKPADARGSYLYPAAYGLEAERGVHTPSSSDHSSVAQSTVAGRSTD